MNQILENKFSKTLRKSIYLAQFFIILIVIAFLIINLIFKRYSKNKSKEISRVASKGYSILRLYQKQPGYNLKVGENYILVIGTLEIPEINISYPVFSECSDELLKISLCRFYGPNLDEVGNLCIAGHNYDNDIFFSKLFLLDIGSTINIYNTNSVKSVYIVYDKYEIVPTNLSYILQNTNR